MQPGRCYAARKPGYGIGVEKRRLAWLQLRRPAPVATLHSIARGNRCQREVSGVGTRCAAHHHTRIEPRGYLRQCLEHLARSFVLRRLQIGVNLVVEAARKVLEDRKSTRLNSSHSQISYAVFCLKKKKKTKRHTTISRCYHILYNATYYSTYFAHSSIDHRTSLRCSYTMHHY